MLSCYYLTTILICLGMLVGFTLLPPGIPIPYGEDDYVKRFAAWDGGQFMTIMDRGYQFDPKIVSNVALFPGFPMLANIVRYVTGWSHSTCLLLVAHLFFILSMLVFHRYVSERFPEQPALAGWSLLALSLFPTTFWFRMAYSESTFLFFCLLTFLGMQRRWPIPVLAVLAGTATAARLVGVSLLFPLVVHIFRRERHSIDRAAQMAISLPLAVWGLVAFMLYQWHTFDEPFAFLRAQDNFFIRPPGPWQTRLVHLLSAEPIWNSYISTSSAYWHKISPEPSPWLNMQFCSPLYFLISVFAVAIGSFKRLLNREEMALCFLLIAIPYFTRGYEYCMAAQARYLIVVFPTYIALGALLQRMPLPIAGSLLALWGFLLAIYTGLFGSWYLFI